MILNPGNKSTLNTQLIDKEDLMINMPDLKKRKESAIISLELLNDIKVGKVANVKRMQS